MARTWSTQTVYEAYSTNVLAALAEARHDVFLCLGKEQVESRPPEAWLASFAPNRVVGVFVGNTARGQEGKLKECARQALATEAAAGRQYSHVLRARPDVLVLRPVPASLLQTDKIVYKVRAWVLGWLPLADSRP